MSNESADAPWEDFEERLEEGDHEGARQLVDEWPESDRTHILSHLQSASLSSLLDLLEPEAAAELLEYLPLSQAADAIEGVKPEAAAEILEELASDDRIDLLAEVGDADREAILEASRPDTADEARALLEYPPDTAGGLMHTELVSIRSRQTAAEAIEEIRRSADLYAGFSIQYLYAVGDSGRLEGVVPLRRLFLAPSTTPISALMIEDPVAFRAEDPLEKLYEIFEERGFLGAPVVDEDGTLLGVVERLAVDDANLELAEADHMKSLGIASGEELRSMPTLERSRRRLAWLSINVVLNLLGASVIALYQETLQAAIALAVFLPIISDMSGCSGNQAVAVSLRELSLGVVRPGELLHVLGKEVLVGLLNGLALGGLLAGVAFLWKGDPVLGGVVGFALGLNTLLAVLIGGTVPLMIKRLGWDPALASSPILTTLTDVFGFFLTLSAANVLLT
ncbi:MAG: magnesium transporter [bacterium]